MKKCIMTGLGSRGSHWVDQLLKRDDVEIVAYVEPAAQIAEQAIRRRGGGELANEEDSEPRGPHSYR